MCFFSFLLSVLYGDHGRIGGGPARIRSGGVRWISAGVLVAAVRNSAVHGALGHRYGDAIHFRSEDAHRLAGIGMAGLGSFYANFSIDVLLLELDTGE